MSKAKNMNAATKRKAAEAAAQGCEKILNANGGEPFEKNPAFRSKTTGTVVLVSTFTGMRPDGGFSYLTLAVPHATFREDLLSAEDVILNYVNRRTKVNFYSSSNFGRFPIVNSHAEPEVIYVGLGRYACSGRSAECAQVDQNNRTVFETQRRQYQEEWDRAQAYVERNRREERERWEIQSRPPFGTSR